MCVSGGRCVNQLVYIFNRTVMLLVPYMWASMTFLPDERSARILGPRTARLSFWPRINLHPVDNAIGFPILIHWIVIYPVDSVIQLLNNWGLDGRI